MNMCRVRETIITTISVKLTLPIRLHALLDNVSHHQTHIFLARPNEKEGAQTESARELKAKAKTKKKKK
jgi:hypothetical protein